MTKMSKSLGLRSALAGLALTVGLVVLMAIPASAASSDCPSGKMCGWIDKDYASSRQDTSNYRETLGSFNDEYSALYNRASSTSWWSRDSYCGSSVYYLTSGSKIPNLDSFWWWDFNDEISSVHRDYYFGSHAHC